jgi:acyl-CoA synthetase (AMP-forming)/AMP-acid ligase II
MRPVSAVAPPPPRTVRDLLRDRAADDALALRFEDESWSWREHVQASLDRAAWLLELRRALAREAKFHLGILLDNVPEYSFLLGAAAFAGAAVVGINPTRRGAELARDIRHTDCAWIVTEERYLGLLDGLDLPARVFVIDTPAWPVAVAKHAGAADPEVALDPLAPYLLIFTSGTTGQPKAALCSQQRLAYIGWNICTNRGVARGDVCYQAMPLFHSNQLMAGWVPPLHCGASMAMRRKFSASGFLPDVRKYGVTFFNYVGKPLTYILATPEQPDDADNPLKLAFGNEGAEHDLERFAKRFGCKVADAYGSTEGSVAIGRVPGQPPGALGRGQPGTVILDPETRNEKPPARFDANGRLVNADECIGEIANVQSAPSFEGYYNNPEANAARVRADTYWTGDLGYRDEQGFLYFAGRDFDWLRVDGENFAAAPLERILVRHEPIELAAVYAVPDAEVGDQCMAALTLRPGARFDPARFSGFLAAQHDLGTKQAPRYVRIATKLPSTETNKILKRVLRRERWECEDPVWLREADGRYRLLGPADVTALRARFRARGREAVLDT